MAKSVLDKEPQAKALYHAGKSLTQIRAKTGVSKMTLLAWKAKYNWGEKGQALPELERKEAAKLESEAEKAGLKKAVVAAKILSLMSAEKHIVFNGELKKVSDNGAQVSATSLAADVLGMKKIQVDPSDEFRSFFSGLKGDK